MWRKVAGLQDEVATLRATVEEIAPAPELAALQEVRAAVEQSFPTREGVWDRLREDLERFKVVDPLLCDYFLALADAAIRQSHDGGGTASQEAARRMESRLKQSPPENAPELHNLILRLHEALKAGDPPPWVLLARARGHSQLQDPLDQLVRLVTLWDQAGKNHPKPKAARNRGRATSLLEELSAAAAELPGITTAGAPPTPRPAPPAAGHNTSLPSGRSGPSYGALPSRRPLG